MSDLWRCLRVFIAILSAPLCAHAQGLPEGPIRIGVILPDVPDPCGRAAERSGGACRQPRRRDRR